MQAQPHAGGWLAAGGQGTAGGAAGHSAVQPQQAQPFAAAARADDELQTLVAKLAKAREATAAQLGPDRVCAQQLASEMAARRAESKQVGR